MIRALIGAYPRIFALGCMTFSMVLWVMLEAVFAHLRDYSPLQVVWTRYVIHVLLMVLVFMPTRRKRLWRTRKPKVQFIRGLAMLAVVVGFTIAVQHMNAGDVRAIFLTAPLIVLLGIGPLFLKERMSMGFMTISIAGFAGGWMLFRPSLGILSPEALLALIMALGFAGYLALTWSLRTESVFTNVFYSGLVVSAGLSPMMISVWKTPTLPDLALMIVIGTFGVAILMGIEGAVHYYSASAVAPLVFTRPAMFGMLSVVGNGGDAATRFGIVIVTLAMIALYWKPVMEELGLARWAAGGERTRNAALTGRSS